MRVVLGTASVLLAVVAGLLFGAMLWRTYDFGIHVEGRLTRAGNATSAAIAEKELSAVLSYLDERGMNKGSTHIFLATPDCDVEFWYGNLKAARDDLNKTKDDPSALVQSNQLIKLRETLMDHGKEGSRVTVPPQLHYFPNQVLWYVGFLVSLLCACGCVLCGVAACMD